MTAMRIPPLMARWALDDPDLTAYDLLWRWHRHLADVDRAREHLGDVTVDEVAELVGLWSGDHLERRSGWGGDLVKERRRIAVALLRTRMSAQRLASLVGVPLDEYVAHVTKRDNAQQWLAWDEAVCAGMDRHAAAAASGTTPETARRWLAQRPWTDAAVAFDARRLIGARMRGWRQLFETGLTPVEVMRRLDDPDVTVKMIQHAYTVWRRSEPEVPSVDCEHCGVAFQRYNSRQRYCSALCQSRAREATRGPRVPAVAMLRRCDGCGAEYGTRRPLQRWCTEACGKRARRAAAPPISTVPDGGAILTSEQGEAA